MGAGGAQTIGYRYYMGLHMGVVHGPVDSLLEIRVGDRTAWSGNVTANSAISIDAPELFGGEKKEGGIQGTLDVMMGGATQPANDYLTSVQGALQTAYRGILSVVFRAGLIACNNPYVKPWAFRIRRILSGWDGGTAWNGAQASLDLGSNVHAMNPAHILYQCLTDRSRGKGFSAGRLDLASFLSASTTFFNEGMGLCFTWNKPSPIEEFMQQVCDHAGAAVGDDPRTGLIRMKAIRADYTVGSLPLFSRAAGNIVVVENFDRAAVSGTTNELTVKFLDQSTGKTGSVTVHHLASIQAQGTSTPNTKPYAGCPTVSLATRIALRDLNVSTAGLARVRLRCTRDAYGLLPGDVIAFSEPDLGIELMPLRIGKVDYGSLTRGEMMIDAVQDVFGLPLTTYVNPQPPLWVEPDRTPQASPYTKMLEIPYRDLARVLGASNASTLDPNAGFLASTAARPAGVSVNYELHTRTGATPYTFADDADWCPHGAIAATLTLTATTVTVTGADLDLVLVGTAALIDEEFVRVTSIDPVTGVVVIARACCDSVPATHAAGARMWFLEAWAGFDRTEYATAELVDAKARTRTTAGLLAEASSPGGSVTMAQRQYRPYPPGLFRLNGAVYPATAFSRLAISWVHRDRLLQQDQLIDTLQASIGPEAGTTYTVRVYQQPSTLISTNTGIIGTSFNYDHSLNADLRVELESVRGGLASLQKHVHIVTCTGAQLQINGVFAADTNWTKGTGWTISAGAASKAAGTASDLSQAIAFVTGATYLIDFTVTSYGTGSIRPALVGGTTVNGTARAAAGTFSETLVALAGNNEIHLAADSSFFGTIDNVVVRRIA